jgi:ComF family protein
VRARLHEWTRPALDLLAPPECAGCGLIGTIWCRACRDKTAVLSGELCPTCGGQTDSQVCRHCEEYAAVYSQARSYAEYSLPFRRLVIRLKYTPDRSLGDQAARLVLDAAGQFLESADIVVPVPLSPNRLERRGYNQVDLFGRPLATHLGRPYRPESLYRARETRSQVGLSIDQRMTNLEAAFNARDVAGLRVLLLDDVFTSGSTANSCARALFQAGAELVRVFTLARAVPGKDD